MDNFRRDLAAQGKAFGLFVAFDQRIQSFPQRFLVEETASGLPMILAEVGGQSLVLGYDFFKRLVERHLTGGCGSLAVGDRMRARLNAELDALAELEKVAAELQERGRELGGDGTSDAPTGARPSPPPHVVAAGSPAACPG